MKRVLTLVLGLILVAAEASAQQKTVTGKVTSEHGSGLADVQVVVKGTTVRTATGAAGDYTIGAEIGQVLVFRMIGTVPVERTVGADDVINVELRRTATNLDAVVVTALGQTADKRALGTAQQLVEGSAIAQTQRMNFVNALQGRVAGVEVISTSGSPGASTSITIRGISSISSSNQPLMIIDGLPLDNKTMHTNVFASSRGGSVNSFENRSVDFTNRAADINPDDIESLVVLKGPEASALYGIDAANGAIVITTKRGRPGTSGMEYSNSFKALSTRGFPDIQQVYDSSGVTGTTSPTLSYFGAPYATGTTFYNNVSGFFRTALSNQHNVSFSGGSADQRINYRVSGSAGNEEGFVPNTGYKRYNVTGATQAHVTNWLNADLSMLYTYADNQQPFKGANSPLLGLLVWPSSDDAKDWLSPAGTRRRLTANSAGVEYDNPYFMVNKNRIDSKTTRVFPNLALTVTPFSWGYLKSNLGVDAYT
ncbi:MAG: TonB-dependent receptor plug domain-containing protein, partial [Gemmatimonadaceae bacterium]